LSAYPGKETLSSLAISAFLLKVDTFVHIGLRMTSSIFLAVALAITTLPWSASAEPPSVPITNQPVSPSNSTPQASTNDPSVITKASFAAQPTGSEFAKLYPPMADGKSGAVELRCTIDRGLLVDCKIVSEAPLGLGFGDAALKLTKFFKLNARDQAGAPVQGRIFRPRLSWNMRG